MQAQQFDICVLSEWNRITNGGFPSLLKI